MCLLNKGNKTNAWDNSDNAQAERVTFFAAANKFISLEPKVRKVLLL